MLEIQKLYNTYIPERLKSYVPSTETVLKAANLGIAFFLAQSIGDIEDSFYRYEQGYHILSHVAFALVDKDTPAIIQTMAVSLECMGAYRIFLGSLFGSPISGAVRLFEMGTYLGNVYVLKSAPYL